MEPLGGSRLVRDYLAGDPGVASFYTGAPWDAGAYERKAAEVDERFDAGRREAMARAIRPTSAGAARRLEEIVAGNGFFVTTGQQAGFLTGPLYTVYKLLSAVRLAEALERVLERPVAPLFWIASEDHDWEEASRATIIDANNQLHELRLPGPDGSTTLPMARRVLGDDVANVVRQLGSLMPPTEFAGDLMDVVARCYAPGRSVVEAFGEMIADLFARFDVLLVDAHDPALKELSAGILARELENASHHEALITELTRRLAEAGYDPQVQVIPGATNLFFEDEAGRQRILRDGDGLVLRGTGRTFTAGEAFDLIHREPARFSPNVFLRPVVESAVFPTLAYVAGPAELAYFAQIGCLFRAHEIEMPIVFPRASVTLVERKVRKVMDKYGLDLASMRVPPHELINSVVRDRLPEPVEQALAALGERIEAGYRDLLAAAVRIDPTLQGPVDRARKASARQIRDVEAKIVQLAKKQQEIQVEQLGKAGVNLYPDGAPQERVLNVLPYLARYGRGLLGEIAAAIEIVLKPEAAAWSGVECGDFRAAPA
ncbi:MAG TPA: bacillithiol biosynthesis cysteine-adding enzyme BshC [Longimicrobiales bacterium]|nr:bacillithiol biosynthesis cysteine-adding enzyme BshC [Longimicrobiales bacterium]